MSPRPEPSRTRRAIAVAASSAVAAALVASLTGAAVGLAGPAGAQPGEEPSGGDPPTGSAATSGSPSQQPSSTTEPSATSSTKPSTTPSSTPSTSTSTKPSTSPTAGQGGDAVTVESAELAWSVNRLSWALPRRGDRPNLISAGLVEPAGRELVEEEWRQSDGDVELDKQVGDAWQDATWSGLSTDARQSPLRPAASGSWSAHRVVFSSGAGTVDVARDRAHVEWLGDVTLVMAAGRRVFHLSDPVLDVDAGTGTLTATVRGRERTRDGWRPVPARTVAVADLPRVDLGKQGLTARPAYRGVVVTGARQHRAGRHTGAFPQAFVDQLGELGLAGGFVSRGEPADAAKTALPLAVDYVADPAPSTAPTSTATPTPAGPSGPGSLPTYVPPTSSGSGSVPGLSLPGVPLQAPPFPMVPTAAPSPPAAALPSPTQAVAELARVRPASAEPTRASLLWWLGGSLLLLAAVVVTLPGAVTTAGRPRRAAVPSGWLRSARPRAPRRGPAAPD